MGCPGRHSLSIYARFSGKKRTSLYIFREKADHYYIHIKHGTTISFSHYNLFNRRLLKLSWESAGLPSGRSRVQTAGATLRVFK